MILQIENNKILTDVTALDAVQNPVHGDSFFITSEEKCFSFYNTSKNQEDGFWAPDAELNIYEKTSILSANHTDVTAFYPNVIGQPLDEIKQTYQKYEADGVEYNNDFRAQLVLDYKIGILTASQIYEVEAKIKNVRELVKNGDWLTAQNAMLSITVDGSFSQTMHDDVSDYINNYILNNY